MPLQPIKVISTKEVKSLNASKQVISAVQLTYMVGQLGPFTLVTTWADIQNGNAQQQMQQRATALATLSTSTI